MTDTSVALASDIYGEGAGPPLVILHGLLGAARNWMAIAKRLGQDHEVHALDLRNHGRSPWADGMRYADMATDVAAYIESAQLKSPTVLGHSMGGKVAMSLALTAPERVGRLIVADISPVPYQRQGRSSFLDYIDAMMALDLAPITRRSEADKAMADAIPDRAVRGFLLQNLVPDEANGGFQWRCNLPALSNRMEDILDAPEPAAWAPYQGRTLFLKGAKSDYVKDSHTALIRSLFPRATFDSLADAGHWLHADQPRPFMTAVRDFIAAA
jgi:pimeloyl-ACP methyl ester carboxylesterase